MTTDSPWGAARRREDPQSGYIEHVQAPPPSVPSAIDRSSHNVALDSLSQTWGLHSRVDVNEQAHKLPSLTESYADASTYHSRSRGRHSPPADGKHGSQQLTSLPEQASSWRSLPDHPEDRGHERRTTDPPLTLHIPNSQGKYIPSLLVRHLVIRLLSRPRRTRY